MTTIVERMRRTQLIAVLRAPDTDVAVRAVEALVAGGVVGIELTYTTPGAGEAIAQVADRFGDQIVPGAGTVRHGWQAREAADAEAEFLVSPGTEPQLAQEMQQTGLPLLLGALTPSEVMAATAFGPAFVQLFPASLGGPAYLSSLRGPFPDVEFCPTGGVNPGTIPAWRSAGAVVLGAGSELCSRVQLEARDWSGIEQNARTFCAALAS